MFERCKQWIGRWFSINDRFSLRVGSESDSSGESLGSAGEKAAAAFLQKLGYRILDRGHRQRLGEIDLIALDGEWIVFVEVKTWVSNRGGDPSLAVDASKQEKLTRAALIYLKRRGLLNQPARFDVVSIVWPKSTDSVKSTPQIRHFKNAFDAVGKGQMYS